MDFTPFDARSYPVTDVASGYGEWAATYENDVRDEMDLRLLERITSFDWSSTQRAADLACGTGRIGAWLRDRGVRRIDGLDLTPEMLALARQRGIYELLEPGDVRSTPFEPAAYDLVIASLVDEHLPDLHPLYREASRLLRDGGVFVIAGYHPQFMMTVGMPTHYHRRDGRAVAIDTHVHLLSDHVGSADAAGLRLLELHEGLIDDAYVAGKPKWERYRGTPVSFAAVWGAAGS